MHSRSGQAAQPADRNGHRTRDIVSIDRAYAVGATSFVTKPVNSAQLSHQLRYVIRAGNSRAAFEDTAASRGGPANWMSAATRREFRDILGSHHQRGQTHRNGRARARRPRRNHRCREALLLKSVVTRIRKARSDISPAPQQSLRVQANQEQHHAFDRVR